MPAGRSTVTNVKKNQNRCEEIFSSFWSKELWPLSSPNLKPMDYSAWSIFEVDACGSSHKSVDALKRSLVITWLKIPQKTLRDEANSFRKRLKLVNKPEKDKLNENLKICC